ncbi:hypothetical protein SNEBB_003591 [Seison nebaliae]|nr:hypothetical protein SNEBB_003591 [Seison nebaliae]
MSLLSFAIRRRFLLFFSYRGGGYSGLARQPAQSGPTIQEALEDIVSDYSNRKTSLELSSRTDKGVHALTNTACCDYWEKLTDLYPISNLEYLRLLFNYRLKHLDHKIHIQRILRVPFRFSARYNASSRTYIYKLAYDNQSKIEHIKSNHRLNVRRLFTKLSENSNRVTNLPLHQQQSIRLIRGKFDIELFKEAIAICEGQHNFNAFTTNKGREANRNPIKSLKTEIISAPEEQLHLGNEFIDDHLNYVNLKITSSSFLYKQIRRMIDVWIKVALKMISIEELKQMLLIPPDYYESNRIQTERAPPLSLLHINYDWEMLKHFQKVYDDYENQFQSTDLPSINYDERTLLFHKESLELDDQLFTQFKFVKRNRIHPSFEYNQDI